MNGIAEAAVQPASLELQLLQMTQGVILHHALCAAARLGIADLLNGGERSSEDLARELGVHEDALYRLLRYLAGQGVFAEGGTRASRTANYRRRCAATGRDRCGRCWCSVPHISIWRRSMN